jgi:transaldolase
MKIFLDTASVSAIKKWPPTGLIDGVTTNPTHLSREKSAPLAVIQEICKLLPKGAISVEVTESNPDDVYIQARKIASIAKNIVVKIPCHVRYYPVIKKLIAEGIPLNITLVFSLSQGLCMAKLGVTYISPFMGRLRDDGDNPEELIYELRQMLDTYDFETQLLVASVRTLDDITTAIDAAAHAATIPPKLLVTATEHELTEAGMVKFAVDWAHLGVSNFP